MLLEKQFIICTRCLLDYSTFSVKGIIIITIPDSTLNFLFLYLWALFYQLAVTSPLFMPILVPFFKVHLFLYLYMLTHTHTCLQKTVSPIHFLSPSPLHKPKAAYITPAALCPKAFFLTVRASWLSGHAKWKCLKIKQLSERAPGKLVHESSSLLALWGGWLSSVFYTFPQDP